MQGVIELIDFTKSYGGKVAVDGVNLCVKQGEISALLGENGAGKTTILKAICGLHKATSGTVRISGEVGYVPEIPILYDDFTVKEMLFFAGEIRDIQGKKLQDSFDRVINDCKLESVLNKRISTLSKGFTQRVSFAAALIHDPEVLVLDEMASGLDPAQIKQMRALVKRLSQTKTVLISTHLMQEVDALAEKIFILKHGKIIASGNAESIMSKAKCNTLEDAFIKLNQDER